MDTTELRELEVFLQNCYTSLENDLSGKVADYIPYLSKVPPSKFAISLCTVDGQTINIGDYNDTFCIQSCSKPFSYCYARKLHGRDKVHSYVGAGIVEDSIPDSEWEELNTKQQVYKDIMYDEIIV